ncbi:hypothetical protein F1D05_26185 [Kribbella qitaiheensis]|uniref:Uncharacterized protein n=1 Tax=Kribbella qitaiheensis TaxID=1544730 RepID=A0A7G6X3E8_9ACTN|nr:hypothetical protein [Kribbella qitaiheensis]QNE20763.1 hypothetical protein F1D05_26185 [Kribbella qitaiheensis]
MILGQEVIPEPAEGDGVSGLLIICVDSALGAKGRAVCDTAAQRLHAEPILGGYTEVCGVVLPRTDDELLTETRLLLADVVAGVTPGAELYFCGVLVVAKLPDDSRSVGEVVDEAERSGVSVRLREVLRSGEKPSRAEFEQAVVDEVQAAAQQLFEDGAREPGRGATLAQLKAWSKALAPAPAVAQRKSRLTNGRSVESEEAASIEDEQPEDQLPEDESPEDESPEDESTEDEQLEYEQSEDGIQQEVESGRRFRWPSQWRRKSKLKSAEQVPPFPAEARRAYLLLLADGTTTPTAWHRCRSIARSLDEAIASAGREQTSSYKVRVLAGGDSVVAQSPLRPAGEADRRGLKSPASSYIDLARVISDAEITLQRDSDTLGGARPDDVLAFVVLAATTPLLDTTGVAAVGRLCQRARVIWLVQDQRAETMLGKLRDSGVILLRDHPEIVTELVRVLFAAQDEPRMVEPSAGRPEIPNSSEQVVGAEPAADRSTGDEQ